MNTLFDSRFGIADGAGTFRTTTSGIVGRALARRVGLSSDVETAARLEVVPEEDGDRWIRTFGSRRWSTVVSRTASGITERIGPIDLRFDMELRPAGAVATLSEMRIGPVSLGRPLGLRVSAVTARSSDRLRVLVTVGAARRQLMTYRGDLR